VKLKLPFLSSDFVSLTYFVTRVMHTFRTHINLDKQIKKLYAVFVTIY